MVATHEDIMKSLTEEQRKRILARADELDKETFLYHLRKLVKFSQSKAVQDDDIRQSLIIDSDAKKDITLSQFFHYAVDGMGGELEIWVKVNGKRKRLTKKANQVSDKPAPSENQAAEPENGKAASIQTSKNVAV